MSQYFKFLTLQFALFIKQFIFYTINKVLFMEKQLVKLFSEIESSDFEVIGKSNFILSKLFQNKITVLNGFFVLQDFFESLEKNQKIQDIIKSYEKTKSKNFDINHEHLTQKDIQPDLVQEISKSYSRLSGFSQSYVNIRFGYAEKGNMSLPQISYKRGLRQILQYLINLYILFKIENNLTGNLKKFPFAVVQKTLHSDVYGVVYSKDILKDTDMLLVEAFYGETFSINEVPEINEIIPDTYFVDRKNFEIIQTHISNQEYMFVRKFKGGDVSGPQKVEISEFWKRKPKLEEKYIKKISQDALLIRKEFNSEIQIGFILEGGKIYVDSIHELDTNSYNYSNNINEYSENPSNAIENNFDLLLRAKYVATKNKEILKGKVCFDQSEIEADGILILKGDENLQTNIKFSAILIEDESELLANRLNDYFNIPVLSGLPLLRKMLKERETIYIDLSNGGVFVESRQDQKEITSKSIKPNLKDENIKVEDYDLIEATNTYVEQIYQEEDKQSFKIDNEFNYLLYTKTSPVSGVNLIKSSRMITKPVAKLDKIASKIDPDILTEDLEKILSIQEEESEKSPEINFDKEEEYIESIVQNEFKKTKKIASSFYSKKFIPTATKIYVNLLNQNTDKGLVNYDGVILSSTFDIELYARLIRNVILGNKGKEIIIVTPPYEDPALERFYHAIGEIRSQCGQPFSIILPDYRNRNDVKRYKKILRRVGIERSAKLKLYANVSKTLNVFRLSELDLGMVDGVYIDLFRIKLNMLGVSKNTASSRFVLGMEELTKYIPLQIHPNLRTILSLNGFIMDRKKIRDIIDNNFTHLSTNFTLVDDYKKIVSSIEKDLITIGN